MKNLKLFGFVIILFGIIFSYPNTYAQKDDKVKLTPEEKSAKIVDELKPVLSLTDQQYSDLYNLYLERFKEIKSNRESGIKPDKETKKAKRKDFREKIQKILSEEQYEKFKEFWKDKKREFDEKKKDKKDIKQKPENRD
jgi:ABC-type phosphate transport system substrate-binding protein